MSQQQGNQHPEIFGPEAVDELYSIFTWARNHLYQEEAFEYTEAEKQALAYVTEHAVKETQQIMTGMFFDGVQQALKETKEEEGG